MPRAIGWVRGLFLLGCLAATAAVAGYGATLVARKEWTWQETFRARAEFSSISGLQKGDAVRVQGAPAGVVHAIEMPTRPGGPVTVTLRIDARMRSLVRSDASVRIETQGVVGAKLVEIRLGAPGAPELGDNGLLRAETPVEMADLMRQAGDSLKRVDAVAEAAAKGLGEINQIAAAIRSGEGTLGRLVKDDEAYTRLIAVSQRGERALGELDENLKAMKSTWPISRYFDKRSYTDRERLLFQTNAMKASQMFREEDLFVPGKSALMPYGKQRLDQIAYWFKQVKRDNTSVVIAAFADPNQDPDLAEILTQDQADAVKTYLIDKHKIQSAGWFSSRNVAAVGFGTHSPRSLGDEAKALPPRRVEIILFTPQG